ncbi:polysaccharide deacetylase family protein [Salisediminibacterium beveridgei]|uniref:Peptidoglycan N-acetylglucosamine deacetylase n=1 Tax=Salisediminibacterium beveridgei TaxID=632773 RepID=A0A1D7QZ64_9BACI|nr:polysaccharide deacetylase family protein [Salisediminibacterium beveridgei]AOM84302.1 Peptidoglycan N-acetylglucosamine deacetylase [Salisediminibacterium beveridgei]
MNEVIRLKKQMWIKAGLAVLAAVLIAGVFLAGRMSVEPLTEEMRAELRDTRSEADERAKEAELLREDLEDSEEMQEKLTAKKAEIEALNDRIDELEQELAELEENAAEEEEHDTESDASSDDDSEQETTNDSESVNGDDSATGNGNGAGSSDGRPDSGERVVYLTFDDGPTDLTPDILSILDDYDVPGNFFVIGQRMENYPQLMRSMDGAGHGIYSHSYTHDYAIYESFETYYEDLNLMEQAYERVLGKEAPPLVRFPGGSSNHSSIEYSGEEFMVELTADIQERGYHYIDWNVSSGDASAIYDDPQAMFDQIVNQSQGEDVIVPLFHDTDRNQATRDILPDVIEYYQAQGYSFHTLDDLTQEEITRMENNRILNRNVVR